MIGAGQRSGGSMMFLAAVVDNDIIIIILVATKLIESCVALLLADQPLAEGRQHFHDNLYTEASRVCVCVCVCVCVSAYSNYITGGV